MIGKLKALLKLTRFEHALLSAVGVLVGVLLAFNTGIGICEMQGDLDISCVSWGQILIALFVPIFINAGAFALNDYFDIEADRKNKRHDRPLVSGEMKPECALKVGFSGLFIGSAFGFLVNLPSGIIALLFAVFSFVYNWKLKDFALVGNLFIAISMGVAFLFGFVAANGGDFDAVMSSSVLLILVIGSVFAGLGREIVKTVQDVEGDSKARGSRTLPVLIGERNSLVLAALMFFAYCASVVMLLMYSASITWNIFSVGLIGISAVSYAVMGIMLFGIVDDNRFEMIRKASLYCLGIAIVGIIISLI